MTDITFYEWIKLGIDNGFCGAPVCQTHDGTPTTPAEDFAWEEGDDPCISIMRIYDSPEMKEIIEANHSPSRWRRTNLGLDS